MYTFSRPPVLRYLAAGILILLSMWWDLRPTPTDLRPFAREDIAAGTELSDDLFDLISVPHGLFPDTPIGGTAAVGMREGDPLTAGTVSQIQAPAGWWTVEMTIPDGTPPGTPIQVALVGNDPSQRTKTVPGVVILSGGSGSGFQQTPGLVAIPESWLAEVASSLAQNRVVVFLGSSSPIDP